MLRAFLGLVAFALLASPASAATVGELLRIPTVDAPEGWDNHFDGQLDAETRKLRQEVAAAIEAKRKAVPNPLEGKRIRASGKGFIYTVYHAGDRSHTKADYLSWLESAKPTILANRDEEDLFMWEIFKQISTHEGDPSSINTYDNQLLTIGPGFSASPHPAVRLAGKVYNVMPYAFKAKLYEHGLTVTPDNNLKLLASYGGRVSILEGNAALRVIQQDIRLVNLLVGLAQSGESAEMGGTSLPIRQWMLEAQFLVFYNSATGQHVRRVTGWRGAGWVAAAGFGAHMAHGGSLNFDIYGAASGEHPIDGMLPGALAIPAYKNRQDEIRKIWRHHRNFYDDHAFPSELE